MFSKMNLMLPLGKLVGMLAVRRSFDSALFQQLLVGAALLVILTIVAALMIAILLAGGLYGIYVALLSYGLNSEAAWVTVSCIAVLLTVLTILLMRVQLTKLHSGVRNLLTKQPPVVSPRHGCG